MLRALMVAVSTMLVAVGVVACSKAPVPVGLAGVGIGPDGQWIGYLQVCSDQVDRAEVYVGEGGEVVTLGIWTAQDPVTGFASWDLQSPGEGWTAARPLTTLADDAEYSMYGGSEGSSTTVGAVHFTKADLAALSIGQVIHWSGSGDTMMVGSEDEFRANACTAYDE